MEVDTTVCIESLEALKGQDVRITTRLGAVREGHLTSVRTTAITIGKEKIHLPQELILNREESDPIFFADVLEIVKE